MWFEPGRLKHYQMQLIDERYLPVEKILHLSHRHHNRLCVHTEYIRCDEIIKKKHSRYGCKRVIKNIKKNETIVCNKHTQIRKKVLHDFV